MLERLYTICKAHRHLDTVTSLVKIAGKFYEITPERAKIILQEVLDAVVLYGWPEASYVGLLRKIVKVVYPFDSTWAEQLSEQIPIPARNIEIHPYSKVKAVCAAARQAARTSSEQAEHLMTPILVQYARDKQTTLNMPNGLFINNLAQHTKTTLDIAHTLATYDIKKSYQFVQTACGEDYSRQIQIFLHLAQSK